MHDYDKSAKEAGIENILKAIPNDDNYELTKEADMGKLLKAMSHTDIFEELE